MKKINQGIEEVVKYYEEKIKRQLKKNMTKKKEKLRKRDREIIDLMKN